MTTTGQAVTPELTQPAVNGNHPLSKSQLAALAAEKILSLPHRKRGEGEIRQAIGKEFGVGKTTVQTALAIRRADPNVFERVKSGELTLIAAGHKINGLPYQRNMPAHVPGRINRRESTAIDRMVNALSQVRGLCRGLERLDPPAIGRCISADDRKAWRKNARESARILHVFAAGLGGAS